MLAALVAGSFLGCRALPEIGAGECGNGVLEAEDGEDCDTFAPYPGGVCRPKGSLGECRLDCRSTGVCPPEWGCDAGGLCRRSLPIRGDNALELDIGPVESLAAADFDGDGRADLVSREPEDMYAQGKPSIHYFGADGALTGSLTFPKPIAVPALEDVNRDGLSDLVFSNFLIGVLRGRADRTWVPDTFTSYRVPGARLRVASPVERGFVSLTLSILTLTTLGGETGLYVPDLSTSGTLLSVAPLPGPVEQIAGQPKTADWIEGPSSPCLELALAYRGADYFSLFDLCDLEPVSGLPFWKREAPEQRIAFEPHAEAETGPLAADLNADGHLDVLIGASGRTYVAYGNGETLATAVPYLLHHANEDALPPDIPMPLAVGEFSGDDRPDFVLPAGLLVSMPGTGDPALPRAYLFEENRGALWTEALIGHLNGDDAPDVVATSNEGLNLRFFTGNDSPFPVGSNLALDGPAQHLTVGDFDGDTLTDLAFLQNATSAEDPDVVTIAFASTFGAPATLTTVGHVKRVEQVTSVALGGVSSLMVASAREDAGRVTGELIELDGNSDRLPLALHTLQSFSQDGSVDGASSLALTVGAFTGRARDDVLVFAFTESKREATFWLIRGISQGTSQTVRLEGGLPEGFNPDLRMSHNRVAVIATSGDLDQDGTDEAVWLVAANEGADCGLLWGGLDAQGLAFLRAGELLLREPCLRSQLAATDVDQDGALDLVLLTGDGEQHGTLRVLWNDGGGHFTADRGTLVTRDRETPRAFSVLPATPTRPVTLAFVTDHALEIAACEGRACARDRLRALERGTGVVAADFNGDRVIDLAVADAGDVWLLKSELAAP